MTEIAEYGLNQLATHLHECGDSERLQTLICRKWMERRYEAGDFTYTGFLADTELAWQATCSQRPADPVQLIRLRVVLHMVRQQVGTYTDENLQVLVWIGRHSEAIAHSRARATSHTRADGLLAIYDALMVSGQEIPGLLREAEAEANTIVDKPARVGVFTRLAVALAAIGDKRAASVFDEATIVAQSIIDLGVRTPTLCDLATALAQADDARATALFGEAEGQARALRDQDSRESALRSCLIRSNGRSTKSVHLGYEEPNLPN